MCIGKFNDAERRNSGAAGRRSRWNGEFDHMTPSEALQWADKNCQPETVERLRSRAAVAALAAEVRRMRGRIECLRGALKSAAGRAYEVAEFRLGDDCMEWAGDMEPPLMGSNT